MILTPHQQRQVEKALERDTDGHDGDCECGPCLLLREVAWWDARSDGRPATWVVVQDGPA